MGEHVMTISKAIEELWVDGNGGYNRGEQYGFTVLDIASMVTGCENPDADDLRNTQVGILAVLRRLRKLDESISCGGINRAPVKYIISATDEEENDLIKKHSRYTGAALKSLDTRIVNSNNPSIKAMKHVINGMIEGLNSLMIGFDGDDVA